MGKQYEIRITGMSASIPPDDYTSLGKSIQLPLEFLKTSQITQTKSKIAALLNLSNDSTSVRGLRLSWKPDGSLQFELRVTGNSKDKTWASPHLMLPSSSRNYVTMLKANLRFGSLAIVSKTELVADASGPEPGSARVFPRDPASQNDPSAEGNKGIHRRRPTRFRKGFELLAEEQLDKFRWKEKITDSPNYELVYPLGAKPEEAEEVVVLCPRFVRDDARFYPKSKDPKAVNLPGPAPNTPYIRSNDFAAISAFQNVQQFFLRLHAYGIKPEHYSGSPNCHSSSITAPASARPGKDGQTVNARVLAEGFNVDWEGPTPPGNRPGLEIHMALANLSTRARKRWQGQERSPAEPLGIAADARWIWHEIGHVVLMASIGDLQFPFAHSPGDALAAIAEDPRSFLAAKKGNWRGATFPWVFLPRRHDRCVSHGWSWGGGLHYAIAQVNKSAVGPRRKGYWSEQILSSSLFRLYQCIGGDTTMVDCRTQMSKPENQHRTTPFILS